MATVNPLRCQWARRLAVIRVNGESSSSRLAGVIRLQTAPFSSTSINKNNCHSDPRPPFRREARLFSSSPSHKVPFSLDDENCNIRSNIADRVGANLHKQQNHPLQIIKSKICEYWQEEGNAGGEKFQVFDDLSPVVSTENNFDLLRIEPDHVSRKPTDTYYVNSDTVLRTHTSAHQVDLLKSGLDRFLVIGDVYRRDEIDRTHYPIFHQCEGVKIFSPQELDGASTDQDRIKLIESDLKQGLEGLAAHLFGPTEMRWVDTYFPFTEPSYELEIYFQDEWLEVLGCGVVHSDIIANSGRSPTKEKGWAFGLGLERLAMVLFQIPDIRLFWTQDERFHSQFASGEIVPFQPYSKYPPCFKDLSFWLNDSSTHSTFHVNDLNELVRGVAGDLVEQVQLIDEFTHPKTQKVSHCYRVSYRSMDRSLTNQEIDELQDEVRRLAEKDLGVELR